MNAKDSRTQQDERRDGRARAGATRARAGARPAGEDSVYRVMVKLRIHPGMERDFERTWREIAATISRQPANLGQSLAKSPDEDGVYYIVSDWENEERFREFEHSPEHAANRMRLDPFRDPAGTSMTPMLVASRLGAQPAPGRVRVALYLNEPESDRGSVENAYHQISTTLAGRPGLRGNELLRSLRDPRRYAVLSEWDDVPTYREWERSPEHLPTTSPLARYHDKGLGIFGSYEVVAAY
ncbi:antibiotic biosynthesis monooxygenase family protein [Sphaerisporangium krabiense]|uniref:Heme-degrading monooxygenase HmoA n=1 Tax=Sphaerisporangium krabiense TaxID=763782 RepID=A0A7W8ZCH7_9ACTN|nr:antibiotic biosynthesis monooxygenase [Sphaerisporangium krabiense]MBB5631370.1 heme-degrading monooxygenase HmoA [Sphaerisporangium krabiense]